MKISRETVDWLSPVWITRGEALLRLEIGLDARRNTATLSGEMGENFFLDIPSYRTHRPIPASAAGLYLRSECIVGNTSLSGDRPEAGEMSVLPVIRQLPTFVPQLSSASNLNRLAIVYRLA